MKKMLLENKQVAIIGGGPGGLTLARLLQLAGVAVKVYERDVNRDIRTQGATLDLHFESGLKAVEAAGLTDAFRKAYRPGADKGRVMDIHARILYDEHGQDADKDFGDELFRPEIDRSDLRAVLLDALAPGTVVWNSRLTGITPGIAGWELVFENGGSAAADIVIGADGANSKTRPLVTDARPFYAGVTILQGNVPHGAAPDMHRLLKGGKIYVHAAGKFLHVSAKGDGSIDFYVSIRAEETWAQERRAGFADRAQLLAWYGEAFAGWDHVWRELFAHAGLPLLIRPQYCLPPDQDWETQADITLLGDAAHIMPPSGEGVNLAMLDALELSECLTGGEFGDVRSAIAAYEERMQARAAQEAQSAMDGVEWMHAEGATERLVQLFRGTPGE